MSDASIRRGISHMLVTRDLSTLSDEELPAIAALCDTETVSRRNQHRRGGKTRFPSITRHIRWTPGEGATLVGEDYGDRVVGVGGESLESRENELRDALTECVKVRVAELDAMADDKKRSAAASGTLAV